VLDTASAYLEACEWTTEGVDLRPVLKPLELSMKKAMQVVYTAVEGRASGLPLFDVMVLLGRDVTLERLRSARARLG
jgi:glutamyl-tRNA synthetase